MTDRCDAEHNPGTWPYTARCALDAGHTGEHVDRADRFWFDGHTLDHDTDACRCGGQWVYFEPYDTLPGAYGCESAGHQHAVDHPMDARGRVLVPGTDDWEDQ